MDFATVLGLIIAVGAILGAFTIEGGNIAAIFMAGPILIVVGGTFGATMITTSMKTVFSLPTYLRLAFTGISLSTHSTIELIVKLAEKARREGILGLESDMREVKDRFLKKAVQLVIDGTEVSALKEILDSEMTYLEERHKKGIDFFQKAGGFAPTMGILGTVLCLVHTLGNTDDAGKMAAAIAAAFIATLWGVALANVFLLPIADKLRFRHEEEM